MLLLLAVACMTGAQSLNWISQGTSPLTGGYGEAVVGAGDSIYVVKCLYASSKPIFYRYDTTSQVWGDEPVDGLPTGAFRNGTALAWDGQRYIYALGGARYDDPNRREFYRYDTHLRMWTDLPESPHAQGAGDALTWSGFDGKLYAFLGSAKHSGGTTEFAVYDPSEGEWDILEMPWSNTDDGASLAWAGDTSIYALRGEYNETIPTGDFARYDILAGDWEQMADLPGSGGIGDGGSLLWIDSGQDQLSDVIFALSGGSATEEPGHEVYSYSIANATWTQEADIPCPIEYYVGNRLAFAGDSLYYWQGSPTSEKWLCGGNAFFASLLEPPPPPLPCEACLERINSASRNQFDAVFGIGEVKSAALFAAQPFAVASCSLNSIEAAIDAVYGIGEALRESIVRYFCPELYGNGVLMRDEWDSIDDIASGATLLIVTTAQEVHGPHTLSQDDEYDWFQIVLTGGVSYTFASTGDSDTYAELYEDVSTYTVLAFDDNRHRRAWRMFGWWVSKQPVHIDPRTRDQR